jgi:hypothetical protein
VIQVERLDRQANAMLIVSGVAQALGGEAELVDPAQVRIDFDAALAAAPAVGDVDDRTVLLEALGLRGGRGGVDR